MLDLVQNVGPSFTKGVVSLPPTSYQPSLAWEKINAEALTRRCINAKEKLVKLTNRKEEKNDQERKKFLPESNN